MSLRHLCSPRLSLSLLSATLLLAGTFQVHAAEEVLRKAVGKGAYEMAVSQQENALWVATSQSRKTDKGGVIYRLDPVTLDVTQAIHSDLKPFGATLDGATQTLWFGNTLNGAVTAIDAKTGDVKGRLVLDNRHAVKRSNRCSRASWWRMTRATRFTSPVSAKRGVIWVVDGATLKLKETIANTVYVQHRPGAGCSAKRLYTTNADGELVTIDTATNKILSRKKVQDDGKEHFYLNISLDTAASARS